MIETNIIHNMDCLEGMRKLPDRSINCCITSPPYWGLRDYGVEGQLGLEETPELYTEKMTEIFREVRRVLKDDGTLWLNLGDSYAASRKGGNMDGFKNAHSEGINSGNVPAGLKPKDLCGMPWRVAFALQADGWYLRQDIIEEVKIYCPNCGWELEERIWRHGQDREIIWKKPNPMPESVKDRCTKAHEYIFLLSKSEHYYYDADAIKEPASYNTHERVARAKPEHKRDPNEKISGIRPRTPKAQSVPSGWDTGPGGHDTIVGRYPKPKNNESFDSALNEMPDTRNKRSVWTVNPQPFPQAHFATFPVKLIEPCVLAGCPKFGIVIDPFMGAGTTALVAKELNRKYVGYELKSEYIEIGNSRLQQEVLPL